MAVSRQPKLCRRQAQTRRASSLCSASCPPPFPYLHGEAQMSLGQRFQQAGFQHRRRGQTPTVPAKTRTSETGSPALSPVFHAVLHDEKISPRVPWYARSAMTKRNRPPSTMTISLSVCQWNGTRSTTSASLPSSAGYMRRNAGSGLFLLFTLCFHPSPSLKSCY